MYIRPYLFDAQNDPGLQIKKTWHINLIATCCIIETISPQL